MKSHKASKFGIFFVLGLITGWLLSLFTPDKLRKKQKTLIETKTKQLAKIIRDQEERERIKAIFDDRTSQTVATYRQAQELLINNLAHIKGSLSDIDRKKYQKAVSEALKELKKKQRISQKSLTKLGKYFENDFANLKKALKNLPKKTTNSDK